MNNLLVGIAAMAGAAGEYLGNVGDLDAGTLSAIYLAVFIGGKVRVCILYHVNDCV